MKTKIFIQKIAQFAAIALFSVNLTVVRAAEPEITISFIPPLGQHGNVEGRVVWDDLTAGNAEQYAIIVMLHAVWQGGGDYYVKPFYTDFLNSIESNGDFSVLMTTGGNDVDVDEVIFYVVERAKITAADVANPTTMTGKYLATRTIYRNKWVNPPLPLTSNIRPGFVAAGTKITLSGQEGGVIRYTLDGSDPITSSTAQTYNNNVLTVPNDGSLLVKAAVRIADVYSPVSSFVWLPEEPFNTPFWGLNVSLALNGEPFGYKLSEAATRERMIPVARLTKWIRTFGTINNGQEYINKIAKELGLHTMIGLYITNDDSNNNAQIEGLRQILQTGPPPDFISVGNETSLLGVSSARLASCIDKVRAMVLEQGFIIPVGNIDIANISWSQTVLEKIDFIGVNSYCGTWDNTPEDQMLSAMKQTYVNTLSTFQSKLILFTETGTPYSGNTYTVAGGTQTPSEQKAANYLCGFLEWTKQEHIPSFYFEAYDEPAKAVESGNQIEQFFGIMDANKQIHSFYLDCTPVSDDDNAVSEISPQNPLKAWMHNGMLNVTGISQNETITVYNVVGQTVYHAIATTDKVDIPLNVQGVYIVQAGNNTVKVSFD